MPENYVTVSGEQGSVYITQDVIASIVGAAISETEGVAGLTTAAGPGFGERIGIKSVSRGVGIGFEDGVVRISAAIYAHYGDSIAAVGERAQKAAAAAVESMTGLPSVVDIHVAGVTFDK